MRAYREASRTTAEPNGGIDMRKVFFVVSLLPIAVVAVQYYLAAVGVFLHADDGFTAHGTSGRIVAPIVFLLLILTAALARAGKKTIWLTVLMLGLLIMQTLIFILTGLIFGVGPETPNPPFAAILTVSLHAINPLIIVWVGVIVARRAYGLAFPQAGGTVMDAAPPSPLAAETAAEPAADPRAAT